MSSTTPTLGAQTGAALLQQRTRRVRRIWYAGLATLTLVGAVSTGIWLIQGFAATNLTSAVPWGAWIAFYLFFLGLSAGSFLLSTLVYVFGMHQFERIGRSALLSAIICMGAGLAFVAVDLGRLERAGNVLLYFHWTSPLSWEVRFYTMYITLLVAELVLAIRLHKELSRRPQRARAWMKALGIVGIPLAIFGVHGGTGTIFAVVKARGMWFGGLFPVIFVVSAMVSGTALLIVIYYLQRRGSGQRVDAGLMRGLATVLTALLLVDLSLTFYEYIVPLLAFQPQDGDVIRTITVGPMWWSFWIIQLGLGMVLPAAMLLASRVRAKPAAVAAAATLVLLGVVGVRFNIVIPAFIPPIMEGLPDNTYVPNALEWALSAGFAAAAALVYSLAAEKLPIHESDHESDHEVPDSDPEAETLIEEAFA